MKDTSTRALLKICIVFVVFPTGVMVSYTLFTFPFGALLSLLLGASQTTARISMGTGLAVGIAGGVWMSRFAWPRRR